MMLTQLEYFVALAREQHFGRAAAACFVSQSALSEAIRKLEAELGLPLVFRGRNFESITPEGERVLLWAQRIVADQRSLAEEASTARGNLEGLLRVGSIPASTRVAAQLVAKLTQAKPKLRVMLYSHLTSEDIVDRIQRFDLDAGLIHPLGVENSTLVVQELARERMVVIAGSSMRTEGAVSATSLPTERLCLLQKEMRARQVLDSELERFGVILRPQVEVDSIEEIIAIVGTGGGWTGVIPESFARGDSLPSAVRAYPLVGPEVSLSVMLATRSDRLSPPSVIALRHSMSAPQ